LRYKSRQLDFPAMLLYQGQVKLDVVPLDMRAERRSRRGQGIFPYVPFTDRRRLPMQCLAESKPTEM
jgi:hypothetical protein